MSEENKITDAKKKGLRAATVLNNDGIITSYVLPDDQTIDEITDPKAQSAVPFDRFGTGGQHVARDLNNKVGWRDNSLESKGPDPEKIRNFMGDEFQGMLGYAKASAGHEGRPAFWSYFTKPDGSPIDSINDLKGQTFKVCFAEQGQFPDKLKNNPSISETYDAWRGKPPEEAAVGLHPRLKEQATNYLNEFAKVTGLKVEIVDNPDDAHLTAMSWEMPKSERPRLLGFASFPDGMNSWARLKGLGQPRGAGFMFLNNNYADPEVSKGVTDQEVRNLFAHEFGHNMGWCHPHDLARLNMSQGEALGATLMAYSDQHPDDFPGMEGAGMGAIDYYFNRWFPEPGVLNKGDGHVYDMQEQVEASFKKNSRKRAFTQSGLLPATVIVENGTNAELHGSKDGNDLIDTNLGYTSIVEAKDAQGNVRGKQKFLLAEGHIAKVKGIGGNNTIIASERGDQVIEPGPGNNEIKFYHQSIGGVKEIISEGQDTLVLSESLFLNNPDLKAREKDGKVEISDGTGKEKIVLGGRGIAAIKVINSQGQVITQSALSAKIINDSVIAPANEYARSRRGTLFEPGQEPKGHSSFTARVTEDRVRTEQKQVGRS